MSGGVTNALHDLLWYWFAALVSAFIGHPVRMPPLLFYLVFGALLGNFNLVHKGSDIEFFAEFSITVVFFSLGFEETLEHFFEGIRRAWGIASIGAAVPFGCGYMCAVIFWPSRGWTVHLTVAVAVTATAVSLTMVVLQSIKLANSRAAMGIMTSAVLDDVGCLVLVAILIPVISGGSAPTVLDVLWIIGKVIIFFMIVCFLHKVLLPHDVTEGVISHIPLVRTYGIKHLLAFNQGEQVALMVVTYALALGMTGNALGFHPAVGAYFAGLILDERYFDLDNGRNSMDSTKDTVASASFMWLGPVFFVHLGAGLVVEGSMLKTGILQALGIAAILWIGQFISATLAARFVPGGFSWVESALIGFGMLGRAELYFVVLNIARRVGAIDDTIFFPMAVAAMLLNITLPICISLYKPIYLKYNGEEEVYVSTPVEMGTPSGGSEGEGEGLGEADAERRTPPPTFTFPPQEGGGRPQREASQIVRRGIGMGGVEAAVGPEGIIMTQNANLDRFDKVRRSRSALSFFVAPMRRNSQQPVRRRLSQLSRQASQLSQQGGEEQQHAAEAGSPGANEPFGSPLQMPPQHAAPR